MRTNNCPVFAKLITFCLLLVFSTCAYAQNQELIQLKKSLSQTKDSLKALQLMNKIGFLIHMNSADSSFYYGIRANRLASHLGDTRGKADALANIAIGLSLKGLYNQSLKYYSLAYNTYAKLPDSGEMAEMLMNSAIAYSFTVDSDQTKVFARRAFKLSGSIKTDSVISMLYANYAELAGLSHDATFYYLKKAETIASKGKDDRTSLFVMQQEAEIFLDTKNFAKAKPLILKSLYLARKHGWDYHELEGLSVLGSYYMGVNQPDSALICYQQIYRVSNTNHYVYWKIEILKSILGIYELKKDLPDQAKTNGLLVAALDQQIQSNNSFLGDYLKYDAEQQKVDQLNQLNLINRKREVFLMIVIIIAVITMVFILLIYLRLRKQQEMLQRLNVQIVEQNEALQENEEFQSKLLGMLAHDFRAPLGHMIGILPLLRDDDMDSAMRLKTLDTIESDLDNILVTFDNILDWVKRQSAGYEYIKEPLNLYDLMTQSISLFKQTIETKNLIISNLISPEEIIKGDKEIIQFINRNVVHNAVKYSPPGGVITVSSKIDSDQLVISVSNEGAGMTENQLNNLFSIKRQDSSERGAGMALRLSSEFIGLLNGKIWAESTTGDGATFHYSLPL